ncbi:MAG: glycosyl transferase, partial [Pseudomonadota bacterium]|nr:glycosyl transferase [Pseudomonadota bacterium]
YEAHKSHAYQRLQQAGYSHQQVLWIMIAMNCILAIIAVVGYLHTAWLSYCFLGSMVLMTVGYLTVERVKRLE